MFLFYYDDIFFGIGIRWLYIFAVYFLFSVTHIKFQKYLFNIFLNEYVKLMLGIVLWIVNLSSHAWYSKNEWKAWNLYSYLQFLHIMY